MNPLRWLAPLALLLALACAPEFQDKTLEDGWATYAVGLCDAEEGKEWGASCAKVSECTTYCCECENGTVYTVGVCSTNSGCGDWSTSCDAAKAEACK